MDFDPGARHGFGEMVFLGKTKCKASVVTDTGVACRLFEAADLQRVSSRDPALRITLLENLTKDMVDKLRVNAQRIAALA